MFHFFFFFLQKHHKKIRKSKRKTFFSFQQSNKIYYTPTCVIFIIGVTFHYFFPLLFFSLLFSLMVSYTSQIFDSKKRLIFFTWPLNYRKNICRFSSLKQYKTKNFLTSLKHFLWPNSTCASGIEKFKILQVSGLSQTIF